MLPRVCRQRTVAASCLGVGSHLATSFHTSLRHLKLTQGGSGGTTLTQTPEEQSASSQRENQEVQDASCANIQNSRKYRSTLKGGNVGLKCKDIGVTPDSASLLSDSQTAEEMEERYLAQGKDEVGEEMVVVGMESEVPVDIARGEVARNKFTNSVVAKGTVKIVESREICYRKEEEVIEGMKVIELETDKNKETDRDNTTGGITVRQSNTEESNHTAPPSPPTTCCMSGCHNCVWIEYADSLAEHYSDGGAEACRTIEKEVEDPSLRAYILMEVRLKRLGK